MKKIYMLLAAALVSSVSFAQVLTMDGKTFDVGGWAYNGTYAAGSSFAMAGTGFTQGVTVTAKLSNWTAWAEGTTFYGTKAVVVDATGAFNTTFTIDAATPVGVMVAMGSGTGYMVQTKISNASNFSTGLNYANYQLAITAALPTDVNTVSASTVKVFPNPVAKGQTVTVNAPEGSVVAVYNLAGAKVDINNLAAGLYTVVVTSGSDRVVEKLIVK